MTHMHRTPTHDHASIVLCRECDWVMRMPARLPGQAAHCPRCHHHVAPPAHGDLDRTLAWAVATLILLSLVFQFDFLSFSTQGIGHTMTFVDAATAISVDSYPSIGVLLLLATAGLPAIYLVALLWVGIAARSGRVDRTTIALARNLRPLEPWMMSDVFIVGVLVSLIKIVTLADIRIGVAFVAFCLYSLFLLRTFTRIDWPDLWARLVPGVQADPRLPIAATGRPLGLVACRGCDLAYVARSHAACPRCHRATPRPAVFGLHTTSALLVTALLLYIPANVYPIMTTNSLGQRDPQTIIGGVLHLLHSGSWPIALVIFVASVIVPIGKIIALAWLCVAAQRRRRNPQARSEARLYRLTERIGRWSMIDVFVVAVLAALVQAGTLMTIEPGPAVIAFAGVVVVTMIAALTFDPRRLWQSNEEAE